MAENTLPVLNVEIDESRLKRMEEIVNKFNAALAIGPGGFKPTTGIKLPSILSVPEGKNLPGTGRPNNEFDKYLKELQKGAQSTLRTFGMVNKTLGMTESLLKGLFASTVTWASRIALLSTGGMFGYDMLANRASAQLRNSQASNMTTGQMQAAQSVYGTRISGTNSIISSLASAQNNPNDKTYSALLSMGINPQDSPGKNLPKVMSAVASILKQYQGTGVSRSVLESRGLGFIDVGSANQIVANADKIGNFNEDYRARSWAADKQLGTGTQETFQNLSSNFQNDIYQLSNAFLHALKNLNGPITDITNTLTSDIKQFVDGPNGRALFDEVASGLKNFGAWLSGPDFKKNLSDFENDIKGIAGAIGKAMGIINKITGEDAGEAKPDGGPETNMRALKDLWNGHYNTSDDLAVALGHTTGVLFDNSILSPARNHAVANARINQAKTLSRFQGAWDFLSAPPPMSDPHDRHAQNVLRSHVIDANYRAGLPSGMMSAIAGKESSWDPRAVNKSGAEGLFQFMPSTAAGYGLNGDDVFDPDKSAGAASRYLKDLMGRYQGDIAKVLTSYNGGRIDKNGNLSLKMETIKYLKDLLPDIRGGAEQHAGLTDRLKAAESQLQMHPNLQRVVVQLDVNQRPGSDLNVSTQSQFTPTHIFPH